MVECGEDLVFCYSICWIGAQASWIQTVVVFEGEIFDCYG